MNIFFVPSWYPSSSQPLPGIFFREQAEALTRHYPEMHIGISTWGQNDDRMLLWAGHPVESLRKVISHRSLDPSRTELRANLVEYFNPRFTWTNKIFGGNQGQIIRANMENFDRFTAEAGKPDLIHAHVGYPAGYIAKKVSEARHIPYLITEQMSPFPQHYYQNSAGDLTKKLRKAYNGAQVTIAISDALRKKMERFGIQNLLVIPNMVDEAFFQPASFSHKNAMFTFFSLGRMVPQKGIDILLHAFKQLGLEAQLRIGGGGKYFAHYQNMNMQLGMDEKVRFLGELNRKQARDEFQQCDAFVLPSRHESMGVVFAEAMACGKPVIGTACGGPEEFVDQTTGIIVPANDDKSLSQAMQRMIREFDDFSPQTIRKKFLSRFSTQKVCEQIYSVYQKII